MPKFTEENNPKMYHESICGMLFAALKVFENSGYDKFRKLIAQTDTFEELFKLIDNDEQLNTYSKQHVIVQTVCQKHNKSALECGKDGIDTDYMLSLLLKKYKEDTTAADTKDKPEDNEKDKPEVITQAMKDSMKKLIPQAALKLKQAQGAIRPLHSSMDNATIKSRILKFLKKKNRKPLAIFKLFPNLNQKDMKSLIKEMVTMDKTIVTTPYTSEVYYQLVNKPVNNKGRTQ